MCFYNSGINCDGCFKGLWDAKFVFQKGQQNVWMSARLSAAKGPQGAANDLNAEPRARVECTDGFQ
jgi:hypothetical protein